MNIYVDLTNQFNDGRLRAILSSGQAVVLHRLAIMSKDGDWIVRRKWRPYLDFCKFSKAMAHATASARLLMLDGSPGAGVPILSLPKTICGYGQILSPGRRESTRSVCLRFGLSKRIGDRHL